MTMWVYPQMASNSIIQFSHPLKIASSLRITQKHTKKVSDVVKILRLLCMSEITRDWESLKKRSYLISQRSTAFPVKEELSLRALLSLGGTLRNREIIS